MLIRSHLTSHFYIGLSRSALTVAVRRSLGVFLNESLGHKTSNLFTSPLMIRPVGLSSFPTSSYE